MPYNEEYPKVPRDGHLKLEVQFRDENNDLFDPDGNTAKITIVNPSNINQVVDQDLTKDELGIYNYTINPDDQWEYGLYIGNFQGEKNSDVYEGKIFFLVSSNAEIRYNWQIMTPEQIIRDYLVGDIGLEYGECKKLSPATIWHYINVAIAKIERDIQVRLRPINIMSADLKNLKDRRSLQVDQLDEEIIRTDISEDPYDYNAIDYWYTWGFLQLREYPVIEVSRMQFIYPTGQRIIDFPQEWIKTNHRKGQIRLVPTAGTIDQVMIGSGGQWLPLMSGRLPKNVPQLVYIDYVAGMLTVPADYKDAVAKMTAIEMLRVVGDAITKGIMSLSTGIDGLSQSVSFTETPSTVFFQARINEYKEDVREFVKARTERDKGIKMTVI